MSSVPIRSEARRAVILLALKKGMPRKLVGPVAGIATSTLYEWMADDPELIEAMKAAEAEFVNDLLAKAMLIVEDIKHKDSANMIMWLLERRSFAHFARKEIVKGNVSGIGSDDDIAVATADTVVSVEAEAERLRAVARLLTDAGVGEAPHPADAHTETDKVHSARTNGHTNGVPAGPES